jgi:hypothetical protein
MAQAEWNELMSVVCQVKSKTQARHCWEVRLCLRVNMANNPDWERIQEAAKTITMVLKKLYPNFAGTDIEEREERSYRGETKISLAGLPAEQRDDALNFVQQFTNESESNNPRYTFKHDFDSIYSLKDNDSQRRIIATQYLDAQNRPSSRFEALVYFYQHKKYDDQLNYLRTLWLLADHAPGSRDHLRLASIRDAFLSRVKIYFRDFEESDNEIKVLDYLRPQKNKTK